VAAASAVATTEPKTIRDERGKFARSPLTVSERFWAKVDKTDTCWLWTGGLTGHGYGAFYPESDRFVGAHTFAWEETNGPVPPGMTLDHVRARSCTNRHCVNPAHLEVVTRGENTLRGDCPAAQNARKTHCDHGHLLAGHNLILKPNRRNPERPDWRDCRTCANARRRERRRG